MTEDEIETLLANWETYHKDWWDLLMEADYGDIVDACTTSDGRWVRWVGMFTKGKNGTFDFAFTEFDTLSWNLSGDELLAQSEGETFENPMALIWFHGSGFHGKPGTNTTRDIILAHQRADGKYHARAGTGVYYAGPGGGIRPFEPDIVEGVLGWVRVGVGLYAIEGGLIALVVAPPPAKLVGPVVAAMGATWGVYDGMRQVNRVSRESNGKARLRPYTP